MCSNSSIVLTEGISIFITYFKTESHFPNLKELKNYCTSLTMLIDTPDSL